MRAALRGLLAVLTALLLVIAPLGPALAGDQDTIADHVLGQPDFKHNAIVAASATSLASPIAVAADQDGDLYVADSGNNRVLEYDVPLTTHVAARRVFGQPDFTHANHGLSATNLNAPTGVALDAHGDLYVADWGNARALEYDHPRPLLPLFLPLIERRRVLPANSARCRS